MNTANSVRIAFDTLRSLSFGSISGTYAEVGSAFAYPVRILKITNNTNADLTVSYDGTNDKDFIPASGFTLYDFCANKSDQGGVLEQPKLQGVYVKQTSGAATSGSVYVTVIFAN